MTVYGPGLATLWRVLEGHGFDPRLVISESEFTPGEHGRRSQRLSFDRFDRLRTEAAELIGDPMIGLRSAEYLHPSDLGALGYSWLASSSLLTGFQRLIRYGRMFNEQETWRLEESLTEIVLTPVHATAARRPDEVADALMAGITALCRLNFGPRFDPDRVTLVRMTPADPGPWFSFFRCPVHFKSDANRLVLSIAKATKPLPGFDPQVATVHDELVQRYLAALDDSDIVHRARVVIIDQLPSGDVREESVSRALNMTERTLQRRLRERGETFRSLLTDVRRGLVRGYLDDPRLSLTEIAFLLGYSDASSFSRAFRSWFGASPSAMRAGSTALES
jgi:AraC-like DNA-binding protein